MSLLWKRVYEYEHPEKDELIVLRRRRLTGTLRQTWYKVQYD